MFHFHIPGELFHGSEGPQRGMTTSDRMAAEARNRNIVEAIQSRNDVAAAWKVRAEALEAERDALLIKHNSLVGRYNQLGNYAQSKGIVKFVNQ